MQAHEVFAKKKPQKSRQVPERLNLDYRVKRFNKNRQFKNL